MPSSEQRAHPPPKTTQSNCDGSKKCQVDVWVEACTYATLNQCLGAGFNFVVTRPGVKADIEWQLTDPKDPSHPTPESYVFDPESGIVFVDPVPERGEFQCGPKDGGPAVCVHEQAFEQGTCRFQVHDQGRQSGGSA